MDLIKISIQRPVFITMVTCFLMALGVIAWSSLPVDLYPEISYPSLSIRATLEGAAPEEMEQLVTKRLEEALSTIAGVKTVRSISRAGLSIINLDFDLATDIRRQELEVRAKVSNLKRSLPSQMREPTIFRKDSDDTPLVEFVMTGNRSLAELSILAEKVVAARLQQLPGVGNVEVDGMRKREIHVELDAQRLEAAQLDAKAVVSAIQEFNRNDPVGTLEGQEQSWLLRSVGQAKTVAELGAIFVARGESGQAIFLQDIATISDGFAKVNSVNRAIIGRQTGPAITLDLYKQSGENSVAISDGVRASLESIQASLPADVRILLMRDGADLIRSNVADVLESLGIGALLTILVVLVFLASPRSTLTTGIALPTSVITTFTVMALADFTINVMTLLALSLAIGLLVDDAIVVRENIFRHLRQPGAKAKEAAYLGTREVILAVLATTFTIIAVFLPVAFLKGISGQFFKQFALTVVFAVLASSWDALTMAPMLSAYFANRPDPAKEWRALPGLGPWCYRRLLAWEHSFDRLTASYSRCLAWLLARPWAALLATLTSLAIAGWGFMQVKKGFLPSQLGDVFSARLNGPLAMPLARLLLTAKSVEERLQGLESLESFTLRARDGLAGNASISLTLKIKEGHAKDQSSLDRVRKDVRQLLDGIPGFSLHLSEPSDPLAAGGSSRFQPIAVMIAGDEVKEINSIARQVGQLMSEVQGIIDIGNLDDAGLPELRLTIDSDYAAHYNLSPQQLSETLNIWLLGDSSNNLKVGNDQIPIRVRMQNSEHLELSELLSHRLPASHEGKGHISIPLANLVRFEATAGPTTIVRENGRRLKRIGANLTRHAALGQVVSELNNRLEDLPLPAGYSVRIVGQSEQMNELFSNVLWALLIGAIFVYMILAALFESFMQPITVMAAIPLAATGAVLALLICQASLDLYAAIGMILLAGIVAKNSILLVDFAMQNLKEKQQSPEQAILLAAPLRLRPILMTSLAMIAGMLPVALGLGSGGAARMSLGIATIGGVISSTFLSLIIVPNLFIAIEKLRQR